LILFKVYFVPLRLLCFCLALMLNCIPPRMLRLLLLVFFVLPFPLMLHMVEGLPLHCILPPMTHQPLLQVVLGPLCRHPCRSGALTLASA
jgi:hypothetical protein